METVIWLVGIALPVAALLFLFGWMVGFNAGCDKSDWGTGFDDGWKAYKELVIETRRTE
ncbi:MAG: hypothetical protein IIZ93_12150 [Acidaminococcaceae bacterium]|nr:hypothetical protein [Acidaminococcaceae bacterium]